MHTEDFREDKAMGARVGITVLVLVGLMFALIIIQILSPEPGRQYDHDHNSTSLLCPGVWSFFVRIETLLLPHQTNHTQQQTNRARYVVNQSLLGSCTGKHPV